MDANQLLCDLVALSAARFPNMAISMNSAWMYIGRHAIQRSDDDLVNIVEFSEALKNIMLCENGYE